MTSGRHVSNTISKEWIVKQINAGKFISDMAIEKQCSKDTISRLIKKYNLHDYYNNYIQNKNKIIKFRINNIELRKALEKYGPLYNIVD